MDTYAINKVFIPEIRALKDAVKKNKIASDKYKDSVEQVQVAAS